MNNNIVNFIVGLIIFIVWIAAITISILIVRKAYDANSIKDLIIWCTILILFLGRIK